jgi:2-polyprenyl-3-methyl-5-hydroxy-6-metoxy-1,4-benzoquinol methylase
MPEYSYILNEAELARYRSMATRALQHERVAWDQAGITAGASVVDLGCGPGAFLAALAERTAPNGVLVGVDGDAQAVAAARSLITRLGLSARARIEQASVEDTGLEPDGFDVVFMRNVLVHNGATVRTILRHARSLLRPEGHLLAVEPDISRLQLPESAADERELEQRWVEMATASGNDPALGAPDRLAEQIAENGFSIDAADSRVDELEVERSPAWTARQVLVDKSFATDADISRWDAAITHRLRTVGLLACRLPLSTVVATPNEVTPHGS